MLTFFFLVDSREESLDGAWGGKLDDNIECVGARKSQEWACIAVLAGRRCNATKMSAEL
jgi:hypothetical protein